MTIPESIQSLITQEAEKRAIEFNGCGGPQNHSHDCGCSSYEAGAEMAAQFLYDLLTRQKSAGVFVRASDRIPLTDDPVHVKIDGVRRMGNFFDEDGDILFHVQGQNYDIKSKKFSGIEWIDESIPTPPPSEPLVEALNRIGLICQDADDTTACKAVDMIKEIVLSNLKRPPRI